MHSILQRSVLIRGYCLGRDFEISLKPKSSPDAARQSMNDANRPSIDNKPNASAATEAGKGIAQTSLQRSSSGWNVWNETGSVNSDGKENLSGGATLTLRAEDPQVTKCCIIDRIYSFNLRI